MADMLQQLGLNFKLLFIQLFGFLILLWLMKKFLWGRVLDMIQKRTDEIRNAYAQNEKTRSEVGSLKNEYEQKLQEARAEAESIVKSATERAEKAGQAIIEKTRQEAEQVRTKGLAEIEQEKIRVVSEIRTDVVNLSVAIASRLLAKQIDAADADRLADEVINEIGGVRQ